MDLQLQSEARHATDRYLSVFCVGFLTREWSILGFIIASLALNYSEAPSPPTPLPLLRLSLSLSLSPVHNLCACVYILVHFCVCVSLCAFGLLSARGSVGYIARVCIWVPCQLLISKPTPSTWLSNLGYLVSALLVGACALVRVLCCCMKAYRPGIVWVLFT